MVARARPMWYWIRIAWQRHPDPPRLRPRFRRTGVVRFAHPSGRRRLLIVDCVARMRRAIASGTRWFRYRRGTTSRLGIGLRCAARRAFGDPRVEIFLQPIKNTATEADEFRPSPRLAVPLQRPLRQMQVRCCVLLIEQLHSELRGGASRCSVSGIDESYHEPRRRHSIIS